MKTISFITFLLLFNNSCIMAQDWQWARCGTGTYNEGFGALVATDIKNNVYTLQGFAGNVCFGNDTFNNVGGAQMVLAKYDDGGNLQWAKNMIDSVGGILQTNICIDAESNIYILGFFDDDISIGPYHLTLDSGSFRCHFLAKYNTNGGLLWAKKIGCSYSGNSFEVNCMTVKQDGAIYICGAFLRPTANLDGIVLTNNGTNTDVNGYNSFMAGYDTDGNIIWAKNMGGAALQVTASYDGYLYVAGTTSRSTVFGGVQVVVPASYYSTFIAKCDSSGNALWAKTLVGKATFAPWITTDPFNHVFVAGSFNDTVIIAGDTLVNTQRTNWGAFIGKYDSSGTAIWGRAITESPDDTMISAYETFCWNVASDKCGNLWVTGAMDSAVIINGITLTKPANSFDPVYLTKFGPNGDLMAYTTLQSGGYFWKMGLAADANSNAYLGAAYGLPSPPFTIGKDTMYSNWPNTNGNFLAKYGTGGTMNNSQNLKDTVICHGEPIQLVFNANVAPGASAVWNDGSTNAAITVKDTGKYWVTVTNSLCVTRDTAKVSTEFCDCKVFLPNAFTPNNDGKNDKYRPLFEKGCPVNNYKFSIYNRWGQRVFLSTKISDAWDGTYHGVMAELGVYDYILEFNINYNGKNYFQKGDLTLIR